MISRPELYLLIADLQLGDVVVAESLDRIDRLPAAEGEALIAGITERGAKIAVPDLIDLSDIIATSTDLRAQIVPEANQKMMLKIALHMARKNYEQRASKQASGIELAKAKGVYKVRKHDTGMSQSRR